MVLSDHTGTPVEPGSTVSTWAPASWDNAKLRFPSDDQAGRRGAFGNRSQMRGATQKEGITDTGLIRQAEEEHSSLPDRRRDTALASHTGLYWPQSLARCGGQKGRRASTSGAGRRRRRQRQPRASLERACAARRRPGFPTPRRRPELPAREQGPERWVLKLRRAPTRSAAWAKEPRGNPRQTRTVRLPPKLLSPA